MPTGSSTSTQGQEHELTGAKVRFQMDEASSVPILDSVGDHAKRIKPLSLLPLIALIFYEVSGGPFGTEVRSCAAAGWLNFS